MTRNAAFAGVAVLAMTAIVGGGLAFAGSRSSMSSADRRFMTEAAEGGQMEVELGELAQQKAASDAVRQFGKRMAEDHGKGGQELAQLAGKKSVSLPSKVSSKTQAEKNRLSKLSGEAFDREYVKMMVRDHEKDVAAFRRESQSGKDPDVKAWAAQTLPTLEDHLKNIRQVAQK